MGDKQKMLDSLGIKLLRVTNKKHKKKEKEIGKPKKWQDNHRKTEKKQSWQQNKKPNYPPSK